ncbi:DNA cytosine methyltransferase [Cupriavidus sp. H19C3]|uniref:DNA cytosine methyltransferase n=1 Tax=Cupriavidus sp. H19C3 TaxID=3241603 RepID=UPI003BF85CDB
MPAYYNEIEPYAAQWLRNLIAAGHIAPGDVDERDIRDVRPDDLRGYEQCHFFAGIGVWSLALRRAGWSDDRPVWTGSCPCQPFSAAGAGLGFSDERHLWPHWHWLISECRPPVVIGEQVASSTADDWIDLVQADVEGLDYAYGCVPFPAAGVSAPHIRDRNYWMAHAKRRTTERHRLTLGVTPRKMRGEARKQRIRDDAGNGIYVGRMADANVPGEHALLRGAAKHPTEDVRSGAPSGPLRQVAGGASQHGRVRESEHDSAGPTNGPWRTADWLLCRDGKWRPVEPGTFQLAHGAPARVGRLRAYGNAINAEAARVFIESMMECLPA